MLKFRNSTIVFFTLIFLLGISNLFFQVSLIIYFVLTLFYLAILVYGSYFITSNFYLDVLCNIKTDRKEIAITFDDGPDLIATPKILSVLNEFNIEAAFFCVGNKVVDGKNVLQMMDIGGQVIGNHTFSHSNFFNFLSVKKTITELKETEECIFSAIGKRTKLFRPPFGVTNPTLRRAIKLLNYTVIGWSIRSFDSSSRNEMKILKRIKKKLKPGAIILFHDTTPNIAETIRKLILFINESGYKIIRLDKLLGIEAYEK